MVDSLKHKPQFLQRIKLVNEKDFNPNVVTSFKPFHYRPLNAKARVDQISYFQARQLYLHGLKW